MRERGELRLAIALENYSLLFTFGRGPRVLRTEMNIRQRFPGLTLKKQSPLSTLTVHPAVGQHRTPVGQAVQLPGGVAGASLAACSERHHCLVRALRPWQLLEHGALLLFLRDLIQTLIRDPGEGLLLLQSTCGGTLGGLDGG